MSLRIGLLWILLVTCAPVLPFDTVQLEPAFRLNQLAQGIADGPAPLRADLARVAIDELAAVYADEARRALRDKRRGGDASDRRRWAGAVQQLADDYRLLANSIGFLTPVDIDIGPEGSLYLVIDGKLVVASSPRMNEQRLYEQRVIAEFCALNRCNELVRQPMPEASRSAITPEASSQWEFSDHTGPVCSNGDGLEFQFRTLENMDLKRIVCQRIVAELELLANAVSRRMASGTRVDWNSVAIHGPPGGSEHTVTLNPEGDTLQLALPELATQNHAFRRVLPWLAAKVRGEHYTLVVLDAGSLLGLPDLLTE